MNRKEQCRHLHELPAAMRNKPHWLLWRFEQREGEPKPRKVPYYVSGYRRKGGQGSIEDRQALATFDLALQRLERGKYDGLGFAFLPGDGLIGIDIDGAIDLDTGELSELCRSTIEGCASYTELSPSGKGVHIIVEGTCQSTKDNGIGLEVFCGSQFFTCTGRRWAGTPPEVQPIAEAELARLQKLIADGKVQGGKPQKAPTAPALSQPTDFQRVNAAALGLLDVWVPALMPAAKRLASGGWRVTSKALGRDLEEDLSLHRDGIKDFGTDRGLTPIDVVVEFGGRSPKDALHWLSSVLGIRITAALQRQKPPPPPDGEEASFGAGAVDEREEPPADDFDGAPTHPEGEGGEAPEGGGGKSGRRLDRSMLGRLRRQFALIYSTDTAFDQETGKIVKVNAMRLAFGNDEVKFWLTNRASRRMVQPEQIQFEPGKVLPAPCINLWRGLAMKPVPGDVSAILELMHHLCGESGQTELDRAQNMVWALRWLALPLQRPGTKMRSALVFHGPQGAGKNLLFEIMCKVYGQYALVVGQDQLEDKFNDWASQKLFLIGDEVVARAELFHQKNKLKSFITGETIQINTKMLPLRTEANHVNVVFLSNEAQPLALEVGDRRYFVIWTPARREDDLYRRVAACLEAGGGAAWMYYLLKLDLADFTEYDIPPMTTAKQDLIDLGLKPHERFLREWLDGYLPLPRQVCSTEQLYRAFCTWVAKAGERFAATQEQFSKGVTKAVAGRVVGDIVKLPKEINGKTMLRIWVPTGAVKPEDVTKGEWAASAVQAFEEALSRYHDEMNPIRRVA